MLTIYTDGSCLSNPGAGGWSVLIISRKKVTELSGGEAHTTNNRMEMQAIIEALAWVKKHALHEKMILFSDSNLLVQSLERGWKRKSNLDLWEKIEKLRHGLSISFHWVKGHFVDRYNNRCDYLAQKEARKIKKLTVSVEKQKFRSTGGRVVQQCPRCFKSITPRLGFLPDSGHIRSDCPLCFTFLKFIPQSPYDLAEAKKRVLMTDQEQIEFLKSAREKNVKISAKEIKAFTKAEAYRVFEDKQQLFS